MTTQHPSALTMLLSRHTRRREFITLLGGVTVWPIGARAQQGAKIPRIGIVDDAPRWQSFRQALRELGYVEGQTVNYEYRYSEGAPDRLATVVGELVRRPVDLIATFGTPPTGPGGNYDHPDCDDWHRRCGAGRPGSEPRL